MDANRGPRVVLVHDWLTGMRGGEKCLEVLCRRWPRAKLYTLLHRRGACDTARRKKVIPDVLERMRRLDAVLG